MTVAIPLIMLVAKVAFRSLYTFRIVSDDKTALVGSSSLNSTPAPKSAPTQVATLVSELAPAQVATPASELAPAQVSASANKQALDNVDNSVKYLMDKFTQAWNSHEKSFDLPTGNFNSEHFYERLLKHTEEFKKQGLTNLYSNDSKYLGHIEKFDLDPLDNPQIYIRADLHGDLKSLLENIRSLQQQKLLDENFKCKRGVHLAFLGDYCDRGIYGTQILAMLMSLREENPEQVHLVRGNHESTSSNYSYGSADSNLRQIITNREGSEQILENFYATMPLTTYFSLNQAGKREYIQCTHGLFELAMDPAPLLDQLPSGSYLPVPKERKLSQRICEIAGGSLTFSAAAKRIKKLFDKQIKLLKKLDKDTLPVEKSLSAYNWADVRQNDTNIGCLRHRQYFLSAQDIRHYLDLSSEQHQVMMIFRGHQHVFKHFKYEEKVVVTTLSIGMSGDKDYVEQYKSQRDRAYIITLKPFPEEWTKRAMLRGADDSTTQEITEEVSMFSDEC